VVFPLSQVVFALALVVSAVLETKLNSGVLLMTTPTPPSAANCNSAMALFTGLGTIKSQLVTPFVASGIDYLTILGESCEGVTLWFFLPPFIRIKSEITKKVLHQE
jgi:hypothetical protein